MEEYNIPSFWINYLQKFYNKTKDITENIQLNTNPNKVCVIIEPRKHPLLKYVIYNFLYFLAPSGWGIHIFCGKDNVDFIKEITTNLNNVAMTILPYKNLTIEMYNCILCNSNFYKSIYNNPEYILIFQTDCLLLDNIDVFIDKGDTDYTYDYIGAPFESHLFFSVGGNGGLSLRNRNTMEKLCEENAYDGMYHEDIFISYQCSDKIKVADFETKKLFSMETVWSEKCYGMHAAYKHQDNEKLKNMLEMRWKELFSEDVKL